jgi:hypothetical protein
VNLQTLANASINHIAANHTTLSIGGFTVLYSYNSLIVVIEPSGQVLLGTDWKYSKTTSKFRSQFLNESTAITEAKLASGEYRLIEEQL